jgi:RNA recognition motif-containing protein
MIAIYLETAHDSDEESDVASVSELPVHDNNEKEENAIFIKNLPATVKVNDVFDLFSKSGRIKVCLTLLQYCTMKEKNSRSFATLYA